MELTVVDHIPETEVHLYCLSDVHLGSPDCDEELFRHDLANIEADPQARVIINGDLLQMDLKASKGDVYSQKYSPTQQKDLAEELLSPIKGKILAMIGGNHDEGRSQENYSPIRDLARFLGVVYCDTEVCMEIPVGRKPNGKHAAYVVFATHGWSSGRQMGGKINNLHRLSEIVLADVYVISHTHTPMAFPDEYNVPDLYNKRIRRVRRHYVNTGSYQKRGRYPMSKGMRPTVLGTPRITLSGKRKHVYVTI